jgi:beta-glucosidase-like glycosyl hydrolase
LSFPPKKTQAMKTLTQLFFALFLLCMAMATARAQYSILDQKTLYYTQNLTDAEKVTLLSPASNYNSGAVPRLGMPGFLMMDGPHGVRYNPSTSFPVGIAMAATFDPNLGFQCGQAMGQEFYAYGYNQQLGPCLDNDRDPRYGRSAESGGEDPLLDGRMGAATVQGIEMSPVIATLKHFDCNGREDGRSGVNVIISDRNLMEHYGLGFRLTMQEGGAMSIMSAYNLINGTHCSDNPDLLTTILRDRWGFPFYVVSDWGAVADSLSAISAGNDVCMGSSLYGDQLPGVLSSGALSENTINAAIENTTRVKLLNGMFDPLPVPSTANANTPANQQLCRQAGRESIVLLKNAGNILPLSPTNSGTIALIGPSAAVAQIDQSGSSNVDADYTVSPLQGIQTVVGASNVVYSQGCTIAGTDTSGFAAAVAAASSAKVVIYVGGLDGTQEGEEYVVGDRVNNSVLLPGVQNQLIAQLAAANPNLIVILESGGICTATPFVNSVKGLLYGFYPGQEGGDALADVLFGSYNPAGRLPVTMPASDSQLPPWIDDWDTYYTGYLWYDQQGITPQYAFGYGLSYTTFSYSNMTVSPATATVGTPVTVSFQVTNTGTVAGDEVTQLYVSDHASPVPMPVKELKAFSRINLTPGQTQTVSFRLNAEDFYYWDSTNQQYTVAPGSYTLKVGGSSDNLPLSANLNLTAGTLLPDLKITRIFTLPRCPQPGDLTTFYVLVKNQGAAASPYGNLSPAISVGGNVVAQNTDYTAPIPPGGSALLSVINGYWVAPAASTVPVTAQINSTGQIAESDTTNNTLTQNVTVAVLSTPVNPGSTPTLTNLQLTPTSTSDPLGKPLSIGVTGTDQFGNPFTLTQPVYWTTTNGVIDGNGNLTPYQSGSAVITAFSGSVSTTYTLNVTPGVRVTSILTAQGVAGTPLSYQITASSTPTSYGATGLPAGLSLNASTGVISGTPTAAGTNNVTITATNANGTGTATLVISIQPAPPALAINCGGAAAGNFLADNYFTGGAIPAPVGNTVDVSAALYPAPQAVYQSNRYGAFTYTLSGFTVGTTYTVRLHFAETYFSTAGSRVFNVSINGTPVLTNFDIVATAGLDYKANIQSFNLQPNSSGQFVITTTNVKDNAQINGIEIDNIIGSPTQPIITSPLTASGTVGSAFNYQITATNSPTSFNAAGLPAGLSLNTTTGVITGTPTAAGTSNVTINAINASGTGSATLALPISSASATPAITSALTASGTVGSAFTYQITASNSPASFNATGLPTGLSINTSSGAITGTPTASGTSNVTISATNASGTGTATLVLTVQGTVSSTVAVNCGGNAAGNFIADTYFTGGTSNSVGTTIDTSAVTNPAPQAVYQSNRYGATTYTLPGFTPGTTYTVRLHFAETYWTQASQRLFNLTINGASILTNFDIFASAGAGNKASVQSFNLQPNSSGQFVIAMTNVVDYAQINGIEIYPASRATVPVVTSTITATGMAGYFFSYQITASNSPTSYSVAGLPAGLSYNPSTGLISGTPTASGTSNVTINATNTSGTGTTTLALTVQPYPSIAAIDCGGTAAGNFVTDTDFTGGTATSTGSTIDTSAVAYPAPQAVYQSNRYGAMTYTIPGFTAGTTYAVRFHFAETYFSTAGSRLFNVVVNGTQVLTNFDIFATAGASNKANIQSFNLQPNSSGQFVIQFVNVTDNAQINGIEIDSAQPTITSALTASGTVGSAFNYQITASNSPTSYSATGLPAGLSVNTTTGLISGTPTTAATSNVTINAINASGTGSATLVLSITSAPLVPAITSASTANSTAGSAFNYQITASNSPTSFNASGMPAGLSINTSSGLISGTVNTAGTYTINLSATNAVGTGTGTLTLTVKPPPPVVSATPAPSAGTVGTAYSYQVTASSSPTSYALASGSLPVGLSLNTTSGLISGTPTTAATSTFGITATNSTGTSSAVSFSITINAAGTVPVITSAGTATGNVTNGFSYSIVATNTPTSYALTGTLPAGLTFSTTTGKITGTPTAAGASSVSLTATNSSGTSSPLSLTITITAIPNITSNSWTTATVGVAFTYSTVANNTPTSYALTGTLPAGLTFSTTTGQITGTPTAAGSATVNITASNSYGASPALGLGITVNPSASPSIVSVGTATATVGTSFTYITSATNAPTSYALTGTLPAGLTFSTTTGLVTGTPTTAGTSTVNITATNPVGTSAALSLVITVYSSTTAPTVTSATSAAATVSSVFSYQITASGTPTSYAETGTLPAGLTFSTTTGTITGTPTTTGTSSVTLTATNSHGTSTAITLAITVNATSSDTNVGLNLTASGGTFQTGNGYAAANDGSTTTRWAAANGAVPQYWEVNLGASKTLSRVDINWLTNASRYTQYTILTSTDGVHWTTQANKSSNITVGVTSDTFAAPVTAQYVLMDATFVSSGFVSAYEIAVFGH